ncbi:MAG: Ppx/GppA phosphatase family protein [Mycobacteriales bacterium]
MTRVAAVDCGTNSVRLLITDLDGSGQRDVHREMRVVRLGQGVDRTGRLDQEALERTRVALADYAATCARLQVQRTRMVATSATRDATNREDFVVMVRATLGVDPEVISGDEEAALSFAGATAGLDPADGPYLVVDIGGGSTEVVLGDTAVTASLSVDIGCVRLTERHLVSDPPTRLEIAAAQADIDTALDRVAASVPFASARTAIGLAGSVTTIAALSLGLDTYDRDRIHHARLTSEDVDRVAERVVAMTHEARAAMGAMHPGRVDVIGAGAMILQSLLARFALAGILVSESDILDGIARSAVDTTAGSAP